MNNPVQYNLNFTLLLSSLVLLGLSFLVILIVAISKNIILKNKNELKSVKLKQERELLQIQIEIQEDTFRKISREIHDNISLSLTLAKLQVNNYIDQQKENNELLGSTIDLISKSLVDLNDISKSLDANQLLSHGLINALESEISVLSRSGIYSIILNVIGEPEYLDVESDLILLRIFQEACNNVFKHAKANTIHVDLIYEKDSLTFIIKDNGIGFDVNHAKNMKEIRKMSGLKNFYNRAEFIGASINIESVLGIGTTITIIKPQIKNKTHGKETN